MGLVISWISWTASLEAFVILNFVLTSVRTCMDIFSIWGLCGIRILCVCVCVWRLKLSQTFLSGSCVDPNVFLSVCLYVGSRWVKTVPSRLSFLFLCMCECVFVFVCVGGGVAWLGLFIGYKVVRLIQNISVVYELVFNCFRIFEVASKLLCGLFKTAMYFGIVRFKVTKSTRSSL